MVSFSVLPYIFACTDKKSRKREHSQYHKQKGNDKRTAVIIDRLIKTTYIMLEEKTIGSRRHQCLYAQDNTMAHKRVQ